MTKRKVSKEVQEERDRAAAVLEDRWMDDCKQFGISQELSEKNKNTGRLYTLQQVAEFLRTGEIEE